jgi:hypothetical protein
MLNRSKPIRSLWIVLIGLGMASLTGCTVREEHRDRDHDFHDHDWHVHHDHDHD